MTKRVLIAVGLAAALAGSSAVALALPAQGGPGIQGPDRGLRRGPRGPGGPMGDFGLRGVELTDAQRDQMRTIMESHQAEFQQVGIKLRQAHRGLAEATQAETIDEAAIRARSAEVASALADEAILQAKVRAEVAGILTPEQQEQLKTRRRR